MTRREAWEEARRLVVQEKLSYAAAAEATGLSVSTLQKRAAAEAWQAQRETASTYGDQVRRLKVEALRAALADAGDPQKLYAWQQLEKAWPEHRYSTAKDDPKVRLEVLLGVIEGLVAYLGEHDRNALTALQPHIRAYAAWQEATWASA